MKTNGKNKLISMLLSSVMAISAISTMLPQFSIVASADTGSDFESVDSAYYNPADTWRTYPGVTVNANFDGNSRQESVTADCHNRTCVKNYIDTHEQLNAEYDALDKSGKEAYMAKMIDDGVPREFMVWRVPEYTSNGKSLTEKDFISTDGEQGTKISGGKSQEGAKLLAPTSGGKYTGYHLTKAFCQSCGMFNSNLTAYYEGVVGINAAYGKNEFIIYECAQENKRYLPSSYQQVFRQAKTGEQVNGVTVNPKESHIITSRTGRYCPTCFGTDGEVVVTTHTHTWPDNPGEIVADKGSRRFFSTEICADCGYTIKEVKEADAVSTGYVGPVDGQGHAIVVQPLCDETLKRNATILYGTDPANITSRQNPIYSSAGTYTTYYSVNYTYFGEEMTINGSEMVHLYDLDEHAEENEESPTCKNGHDWQFREKIDPTCDDLGFDIFECSKCGKEQKRNYVSQLNHNFDSKVIKEASCTENGTILHKCLNKNCDEVYEETTPKTEHVLVEKTIPSTCTEQGKTIVSCKNCTLSYEKDSQPLAEHKYSNIIEKAPTCTTDGYISALCDVCKQPMYKVTDKALGHHLVRHLVSPATCTSPAVYSLVCDREGCNESFAVDTSVNLQSTYANAEIFDDETVYAAQAQGLDGEATGHTPNLPASTCTEDKVCTKCGAVLEAKKGHDFNYSSGKPVRAATCSVEGQVEYKCNREGCGVTTVVNTGIDASKHNPNIPNPTCTEAKVCQDCGVVLAESLGHKWNDGVDTTLPTCKSTGVKLYTCLTCGETRTVETDPTSANHTPGSPATCTTPQVCTVCQTILALPTGHNLETGVVEKEATCSSVGIMTYNCSKCSYVKKENIPISGNHKPSATSCTEPQVCTLCGVVLGMPTGHSYDIHRTTKEATCTENGEVEYECSRCHNKKYEVINASAKGHKPGAKATCTEPQTCSICGTVLELPTGHVYREKEIAATCTSMGYTHFSCTKCDYSYDGEYTNVIPHDYVAVLTPATCTDFGYTTYTCHDCNASYVSDYVKPKPHDYVETITPPTCTTLGFSTFKCRDCDDEYTSKWVAKTEHNYTRKVVPPTCEELGYTIYKCPDCGAEYIGDETNTVPHNYREDVTEPTCTEMGYTTYTCNDCGYSYVGDYVDPKHHSYTAVVTEPTCTSQGYTTYTCDVCGDEYVADEKVKLDHDYQAVVTEPTCTSQGYTTYTCSVCGDHYVADEKAMIPHEYEITETPSTCTGLGYKTYKCKNCGYSYQTEETGYAAHQFEETVTPPTCHSLGYTTYRCSVCGFTYKGNETAKTEHDFMQLVTPPTCTTLGYTTYQCKNCPFMYIGNETATIPHNYEAQVTPSTCNKLGYTTYTCSECGDSYIETATEFAEHSYDTQVVPPTCVDMGYTKYTCSACGDTYNSDFVPATGHKNQAVVTAASCTELGYTTYTCEVCGKSFRANETALAPHELTSKVTEPTCTEHGYTTYTCKNCDYSYTGDYVDALGHDPSDWIVDVEPTIVTKGSRHIECERCGETLKTEEMPRLTEGNKTDEDGYSEAGKYLFRVKREDALPVFDATIVMDTNDNVFIILPDGKPLDYTNCTVITAVYKDDKETPAEGLRIYVTDAEDHSATGVTDAKGMLVVPNQQSSTGHSNGTVGGEIDDNLVTYVVTVTDKNDTVIPNCNVEFGHNHDLVVTLPDGTAMDADNRITVTVTNAKNEPQKDVSIIVMGDDDNIEKGYTNGNGRLTVPKANRGYTDKTGQIAVNDYIVKVRDESKPIYNAFVQVGNDDNISVILPDGKVIDYRNRTTVTVLQQKELTPVEGLTVSVADNTGKERQETTNENGEVTVPPWNEDETSSGGTGDVTGDDNNHSSTPSPEPTEKPSKATPAPKPGLPTDDPNSPDYKPSPSPTPDASKRWPIIGDVDHSGLVDNVDAVLVMQYVLGQIDENALDLSVANVYDTTNTTIDNNDAVAIMQYVLGQIPSLPQEVE